MQILGININTSVNQYNIIRKVILVLLCVWSAFSVTASDEKVSHRVFARAAFGSQYALGFSGEASRCVERLKEEIEVTVVGHATVKQKEIIRKSIAQFSLLSNVLERQKTVEGEDIDRPSQIRIYLKEESRTTSENFKSHCSAERQLDFQCRIKSVDVLIPINISQSEFTYCINHEMMHAFGFQGHAWKADSILNPRGQNVDITAWDKRALKLLYNPALTTGMSTRKATNIVKGLLSKKDQNCDGKCDTKN